MKYPLRFGLVVSLLALLIPSGARAEIWNHACGASWTNACHSVRITYHNNLLQVTAFNGSLAGSNAQNSVLTKVLMRVRGAENARLLGAYGFRTQADYEAIFSGRVGDVRDLTDAYRIRVGSGVPHVGGHDWNVAIARANGHGNDFANGVCLGIVAPGATDLPCGDRGDHYYAVSWVVQFNEGVQLEDLQIAMHAQHLGGGDGSDWTTSGTSTAPEPLTMILLGTGLAGVGGVGLIRRRRNRELESGERT